MSKRTGQPSTPRPAPSGSGSPTSKKRRASAGRAGQAGQAVQPVPDRGEGGRGLRKNGGSSRNGRAPGEGPSLLLEFGEAGPSRQLDATDWTILRLLQPDARVTSTELARQVELSPAGLQKRLRKLEDDGVVQRYVTLVDRETLGLDLLCFVQVTLAHHQPNCVHAFREAVQGMPEILECHHLTGEFDYLLKVVVVNHKHLDHFLFEGLTQVRGVDKIRTSIVLNEIKSSTALPID